MSQVASPEKVGLLHACLERRAFYPDFQNRSLRRQYVSSKADDPIAGSQIGN